MLSPAAPTNQTDHRNGLPAHAHGVTRATSGHFLSARNRPQLRNLVVPAAVDESRAEPDRLWGVSKVAVR